MAHTNPTPKKKGGCLKIGAIIAGAVVGVIILIAIIAGMSGGNTTTTTPGSATSAPVTPELEVTATQLVDDLEGNALGASNKYRNKVIKLTGEFATVDSSGRYFTVKGGQAFSMTNIRLDIEKGQQEKVGQFTAGDTVTVVGTVTDVGEFMGYTVDVHEIV